MRPPFLMVLSCWSREGRTRRASRHVRSWRASSILHGLIASILIAPSGCGVLGPDSDPTLLIRGHVRSQEGVGVPGAIVSVSYEDFLRRYSGNFGRVTSDQEGAFRYEIDAQPGYARPNCATMTVHAVLGERSASFPLAWSDKCRGISREVDGVVLTLPDS
jgi:hypothetical protein